MEEPSIEFDELSTSTLEQILTRPISNMAWDQASLPKNDDDDVDDCPKLSDYFSDPESDDGSSDSDDYPDLAEDSGVSDSDSDCDFDDLNHRPFTNMLRFTYEPKKSAKSNISKSKTTPIVDNIRTPAPIVDNIQTPPGTCPVVSCNYCAPPNPSMAKREHNLKVHIATKHLTSVEFQEDFWISHNWLPCLACKKFTLGHGVIPVL